jgi:hypothetical protein
MRRITSALAVVCLLLFALPLLAQSKPYHDGSVWEMQCIHVKAGMEDRYARYLVGDWKKEQDAMRKAGYVLSYKDKDGSAQPDRLQRDPDDRIQGPGDHGSQRGQSGTARPGTLWGDAENRGRLHGPVFLSGHHRQPPRPRDNPRTEKVKSQDTSSPVFDGAFFIGGRSLLIYRDYAH